jgi:hypothetical protein
MITAKATQSDGRKAETDNKCVPDSAQPLARPNLEQLVQIWVSAEKPLCKHYDFCDPYRDKRGASSPIIISQQLHGFPPFFLYIISIKNNSEARDRAQFFNFHHIT